MNLEKFTDRAKGFLQAAQTVAIRLNHQRISPAHLLKALLDDEQGMAAQLIQRAGGNPGVAITEVDNALAKVPAVSGGGAQQTPGLDNDAVRALDSAEQLAFAPRLLGELTLHVCFVEGPDAAQARRQLNQALREFKR